MISWLRTRLVGVKGVGMAQPDTASLIKLRKARGVVYILPVAPAEPYGVAVVRLAAKRTVSLRA